MNKEIKYIFPNEALQKFDKEDVGTALFCNSFYNGKNMVDYCWYVTMR